MALARCEQCGCPRGTRYNYTRAHKPLFLPSRVVICASRKCTRLASVIWLTDEEQQQYLRGERIFRLASHAGKVLVT
jgi:hypothetical protein